MEKPLHLYHHWNLRVIFKLLFFSQGPQVPTFALQDIAFGSTAFLHGTWHKSYPEMSLRFLQMATKWFGSHQVELADTATTLCGAVRSKGIRDLTDTLLTGIGAGMTEETYWYALELLKTCQPIYPNLPSSQRSSCIQAPRVCDVLERPALASTDPRHSGVFRGSHYDR